MSDNPFNFEVAKPWSPLTLEDWRVLYPSFSDDQLKEMMDRDKEHPKGPLGKLVVTSIDPKTKIITLSLKQYLRSYAGMFRQR
jgi:hypothetical protein